MENEEIAKPAKVAKTISQLTDSIGWVSFTPFQMEQFGINVSKNTTSDLRKKVVELMEKGLSKTLIMRKPREKKVKAIKIKPKVQKVKAN